MPVFCTFFHVQLLEKFATRVTDTEEPPPMLTLNNYLAFDGLNGRFPCDGRGLTAEFRLILLTIPYDIEMLE